MTWDSGACEPGLEGTDLDPATWVGRDADDLRALARHFEDLLDQLRAGQAAQTGDELAARRTMTETRPCPLCNGSGEQADSPDGKCDNCGGSGRVNKGAP